MSGNLGIRQYSCIGVLTFAILGSLGFIWYAFNPKMLFLATGLFSAAIALLPPAILKNYDPISTWSFATLSIVLGLTIRGLYISIGYPDENTLDFLFYLGKPVDDFFWPSLLLLAAILSLALGYVFGPVNEGQSAIANYFYTVNINRMYLVIAIIFIVSLVATIAYIHMTGGFDFSNLSKKRTLISSPELSESHRTWQSLRTVASLALFAHLLVLADALNSRNLGKVWKYCLALALFLLAAFLPFYASSRGLVFMYVILSLAITYCVKKKLSWSLVLAVGVGGIVVFQAMSVLRTAENVTITEAIKSSGFGIKILDRLVLNRNNIDLSKTAHIIHAISDRLEYQYGKTIAVWLVAPIPREIWNSKPLISPGPIIGTTIYGNKRSGVPPGFVGEMYWNFHIPGVLIGGVILGWLMKWVHIKFRPKRSNDMCQLVVYIYGPIQLGYLALGTSVGYGLVTTVINTLLALVIVRLIRVRCSVLKA